MAKDVVEGLRMFVGELRRNAERSTSVPQQESLAGRAMIVDGGANEIEQLRGRVAKLEKALQAILAYAAPYRDDSHAPLDRIAVLAQAAVGGQPPWSDAKDGMF